MKLISLFFILILITVPAVAQRNPEVLDQNRLFAGIRQQITPSLSFGASYMLVYQQRLSGYQYNRNHTFRLFFFWQPDFRKKQNVSTTYTILPDDQ